LRLDFVDWLCGSAGISPAQRPQRPRHAPGVIEFARAAAEMLSLRSSWLAPASFGFCRNLARWGFEAAPAWSLLRLAPATDKDKLPFLL
jgi:hypothetical protein